MSASVLSTATATPAGLRMAFERCIAAGGVALFPAEGVYGLACDPLNQDAVARIHEIKGRDEGKPSAVMYFSTESIRELLGAMPPAVGDAVGRLLPGPVTLIVPNPEGRYPLACREDRERLGIRLIEGLLSGVTTPVFQTSANPSGEPAPHRFEDVAPGVRGAVDLAIDGGELGGRPSTVIDLTGLANGSGWQILREGAMPAAAVGERLSGLAATPSSEGR